MFRLIFLSIIFFNNTNLPIIMIYFFSLYNNTNSILIIHMDAELTTPVHLLSYLFFFLALSLISIFFLD